MPTTLPKTVPVLTAKDMYKGDYSGPDGTHCLLGWGSEVGIASVLLGFYKETGAGAAIRAESRRIGAVCASRGSVMQINDHPKNPPSLLARIWNGAMRRLGYVRRGNKFVLMGKGR